MRGEKSFSLVRVLLLGFGFLSIAGIWAVYNAFVPIFLKVSFKLASSAIGSVMTIDNIFAVLLVPFIGAMSDRTQTSLGRRRPYILIGSPVACVFFFLVPLASTTGVLDRIC